MDPFIEIRRKTVLKRDPRQIKYKKEFYALYGLGFFGNRVKSWPSFQEMKASGWRGLVCIRGENIPRDQVRYNIPFKNVRKHIKDLGKKGFQESILRFNQGMPDEHLLIQGEVIAGTKGGLELTYTTVKVPMLDAMKEETLFAHGMQALMLLRGNMDASSFRDLEAMIHDIYPMSVVEFSTYSRDVGDIPNRNTVFWEVRDY